MLQKNKASGLVSVNRLAKTDSRRGYLSKGVDHYGIFYIPRVGNKTQDLGPKQ
jgi:hypothetical protein